MGEISNFTPSQLRTIRRTVAPDTNDAEFDMFIEAARSYGLDPFRRQISAIVFSKDKPDKRRMTIIVGRDGLRTIAMRNGDYRPASKAAQFDIDPDVKGPTNPQGIVRCAVELHKQDKRGDWYPVYGEAYWDEFAPLKEVWDLNRESGKREPTGKFTLEHGNWTKMPRLMIQKCAEAQALRAGWPDQFGGLYAEEEIDQARVREMRDVTPSEAVNQEDENRRRNLVGDKGVLMVLDQSGALQRVPLGQIADRCMEFIRDHDAEIVHRWKVQNTEAFREFWAMSPNEALEVKRAVEAKTAQIGHAA